MFKTTTEIPISERSNKILPNQLPKPTPKGFQLFNSKIPCIIFLVFLLGLGILQHIYYEYSKTNYEREDYFHFVLFSIEILGSLLLMFFLYNHKEKSPFESSIACEKYLFFLALVVFSAHLIFHVINDELNNLGNSETMFLVIYLVFLLFKYNVLDEKNLSENSLQML